jgi:hypothetical protein
VPQYVNSSHGYNVVVDRSTGIRYSSALEKNKARTTHFNAYVVFSLSLEREERELDRDL